MGEAWTDELGELLVPAAPAPTVRQLVQGLRAGNTAQDRSTRQGRGRVDLRADPSAPEHFRKREILRITTDQCSRVACLDDRHRRLLRLVRATGLGRRDGKGARGEPEAS